jgi:hypothetical protein
MYRYKYNKSYHHKSQRARKTGVLAIVASLFVLAGIGYVARDVYKQLGSKQAPVSQATYSSVQGASINLFKTEFFQFQAGDSWKEATTETKDGHYVYRSFKGTLVERDLIIDINKTAPEVPALVRTTRVMPVNVESDGRLSIVEGAGEHCKTQMPKNAPLLPTKITAREVSFICTPDAVIYQVLIGVVGGTTNIAIPRPSGTKATYTIQYRDLTVSPNDNQLRNIISTFQSR